MDTKSAIQVSSNSSQEILQQEPNDRQNSVGISKKDDRKNSKESELNSLKEMLLRQVSIREKFEKGLERADKEIQKAKESISNEEKMLTEMKASLLSKVRSIKLLPESQGSIEKLENAKFESEERMKVMIAEWNSIKQSLEERVKYLENRLNERKDNCRKKLNQMQTMRDEISNMQKQFTIRENTLKELTEQLSNEERQANRQFYVDRIFNIVKTLRDQKQQIDKEIVDIRSLQKDINYRSGVSSRNWKMVTDLVYKATQSKDTTKSSSLQQTFDHLLALQKIFDEIVTLLHDIGSTRNDCRDLKIKIESIDTNSLTSKSKKLSQDLAAIRKSNQV